MSRCTVIGAGGFIGSRLAQALRADGREVYAPARGDAAVFEQDLGQVFYCAGLTGDYRQKPFEAVEAHVSLLARVLERARFERLVYLSSTRLYDALADGEGREDRALPLDPNDPRHVYELSKALGENLVATQAQGRGVAARLSYVFDWVDGAEGFLSDWLRAARARGPLSLDSSPSAARDYIHLDDVVRALRALADADLGGIVNVASGERVSNAELAQVFAAAGRPVTFTQPAAASHQVACDVSRLAGLGVRARPVPALIAGHLADLDQGPPPA